MRRVGVGYLLRGPGHRHEAGLPVLTVLGEAALAGIARPQTGVSYREILEGLTLPRLEISAEERAKVQARAWAKALESADRAGRSASTPRAPLQQGFPALVHGQP